MAAMTRTRLARNVALADALRQGRSRMIEPQDLPGRYGRVVKAVDRVLAAVGAEAVLAGGWAVWRHGYAARVTEDIDVAIAADQIDDFLRTASVSGFDVLRVPEGRWPKMIHRDTGVQVDILPEGARPGAERQAPTTIPAPSALGAKGAALTYISLPALIELKLAAGRSRDENDVVELIRSNSQSIDAIRKHLDSIHAEYVQAFAMLEKRAAFADQM